MFVYLIVVKRTKFLSGNLFESMIGMKFSTSNYEPTNDGATIKNHKWFIEKELSAKNYQKNKMNLYINL